MVRRSIKIKLVLLLLSSLKLSVFLALTFVPISVGLTSLEATSLFFLSLSLFFLWYICIFDCNFFLKKSSSLPYEEVEYGIRVSVELIIDSGYATSQWTQTHQRHLSILLGRSGFSFSFLSFFFFCIKAYSLMSCLTWIPILIYDWFHHIFSDLWFGNDIYVASGSLVKKK